MQSTYVMCIYYEQNFHEDLEDVRRKWGIVPALFLLNKTLPEHIGGTRILSWRMLPEQRVVPSLREQQRLHIVV
ncbi:hypothetical protein SLA2020_406540 [Shorea laevis]